MKRTFKMKSIQSVPLAQAAELEGKETLLDVLLSTSEEEEGASTWLIQVKDYGSHSKFAKVDVQGVSVEAIIDSGAGIMNEFFFHKVAAEKTRSQELLSADFRLGGLDGTISSCGKSSSSNGSTIVTSHATPKTAPLSTRRVNPEGFVNMAHALPSESGYINESATSIPNSSSLSSCSSNNGCDARSA